MGKIENALLTGALSTWALLGLGHTAIVLAGRQGLRPDRSAPGADAVIGHPSDVDARLVAGPRALVAGSGTDAGQRLLLVLPEATDSGALLYARYQLANVLYPRRVAVERAAETGEHPSEMRANQVVVVDADVAAPIGCRAADSAFGYHLLDCGP